MGVCDHYPWGALRAVPANLGSYEHAARLLLQRFDLERLGETLGDLTALTCDGFGLESKGVARSTEVNAAVLEFAEGTIALRPEPELVAFMMSRVLDQPFHLADPQAPLGAALSGAFHALVYEVVRRLVRGAPPTLSGARQDDSQVANYNGWLRLDGRTFRLDIAVAPGQLPQRSIDGDVPVTLGIVVEQLTFEHAELLELRRGDAVIVSATWVSPEAPGKKTAVAASSLEERGFGLELIGGEIRYTGPTTLPFEPAAERDGQMAEPKTADNPTQESMILEAPVVVRLELGSITLMAREWMALKPGDVIKSGQPTNGPITLRCAGMPLAQGELVTVDGELAVRITELSPRQEPWSSETSSR